MAIEVGLTAIAIVVSLAWPGLGSLSFSRVEHMFRQFARKRNLAVVVVGLSAPLLRLAMIPLCPIPQPFAPDDFSFLLAADTFAHGRLANPTPAMWTHFETIHISMQPTYMSMYFPGQGLALAAGQLLLGHPWYGILCASSLMCAAICWMLQAWLPPGWALLGGALGVIRLGVFSYWVNSYTGAGTISALGGALVLGALPRFIKDVRLRYSMLLAAGIAVLTITRPYEGMLLCVPVAAVIGRWLWSGKNRPLPPQLFRLIAAPLALVVAAGAWMGYYDYRVFGNLQTLPYAVNRATYAMAPYYVWQSARPEPPYRHEVLRKFYKNDELEFFTKIHTLSGFIPQTLCKVHDGILFFSGAALLFPLIMLRRVFLDRRVRFLILCALVLMAGMAIEIYLVPHYLAPFAAVFYAIGLQAMRHLRVWSPEGRPVGRAVVRSIVVVCLLLAALRICNFPLCLRPVEWPPYEWLAAWYGPGQFGTERARVKAALEQLPGKQLVLVRYSANHIPMEEWVSNAANIETSKVIWAREMDAANNLELMRYYRDRKVWLVEPDTQSIAAYPFSATERAAVASQ